MEGMSSNDVYNTLITSCLLKKNIKEVRGWKGKDKNEKTDRWKNDRWEEKTEASHFMSVFYKSILSFSSNRFNRSSMTVPCQILSHYKGKSNSEQTKSQDGQNVMAIYLGLLNLYKYHMVWNLDNLHQLHLTMINFSLKQFDNANMEMLARLDEGRKI